MPQAECPSVKSPTRSRILPKPTENRICAYPSRAFHREKPPCAPLAGSPERPQAHKTPPANLSGADNFDVPAVSTPTGNCQAVMDTNSDSGESYAAFSRFNSSSRPIISTSELAIDGQSISKSPVFGNDTIIRFQN